MYFMAEEEYVKEDIRDLGEEIACLKPRVYRNEEDIQSLLGVIESTQKSTGEKMDKVNGSIISIEKTIVGLSTKMKIYLGIIVGIFALIAPSISAVICTVILAIAKLAFDAV